MNRKLSKTAIRRRRIVVAIEAVLTTGIICGIILGTFELCGFVCNLLGVG